MVSERFFTCHWVRQSSGVNICLKRLNDWTESQWWRHIKVFCPFSGQSLHPVFCVPWEKIPGGYPEGQGNYILTMLGLHCGLTITGLGRVAYISGPYALVHFCVNLCYLLWGPTNLDQLHGPGTSQVPCFGSSFQTSLSLFPRDRWVCYLPVP